MASSGTPFVVVEVPDFGGSSQVSTDKDTIGMC